MMKTFVELVVVVEIQVDNLVLVVVEEDFGQIELGSSVLVMEMGLEKVGTGLVGVEEGLVGLLEMDILVLVEEVEDLGQIGLEVVVNKDHRVGAEQQIQVPLGKLIVLGIGLVGVEKLVHLVEGSLDQVFGELLQDKVLQGHCKLVEELPLVGMGFQWELAFGKKGLEVEVYHLDKLVREVDLEHEGYCEQLEVLSFLLSFVEFVF